MKRSLIAWIWICLVVPALSQPLTGRERDRAVAELQASRKAFLESLAGLSPAQWDFKSAPDRWSIAECAEHVALAEDSYFELIAKLMRSPATPEKKAEVVGKDDLVLKVMPDRTSRRVAPELLQPARRWTSPQALIAHFNQSRDRLIAYVKTTPDDLRTHFQAHRAVGLIDAYQWILLASGHTVRHTLQIQEVKAHPAFPRK
jgi:DinB superfamily